MIPILEGRGLQKTYRLGASRVRALDGVDIQIHRGDFLVLQGPSGSGKTTLINLLGFLICTFALLALLFRVQVTHSRKKIFLLSAMTTIAAFIIFDKWLGVQLPRGLLGYRFF